jgi:hypothetical protein
MSKKDLKIKRWRVTHKKLFEFLDRKIATGNEIRDWVADCVVYFSEVNIQENIINNFINKLDYYEVKKVEDKNNLQTDYIFNIHKEEKDNLISGIGPFPSVENGYVITFNNNRLSPKYADKTQMTIIFIAFKVAERILDNYEEEETIVPNYILEEFNTEKTQDIYLSLKSIQTAYEKRSSKNIVTPIVTTTELVCKLIPELVNKRDISEKLNKIYSDEKILKKYMINKEIVWALNNSRIIRNYDIHYPKKENHTTLYEAVGYCHLLILFISSLLASGEIKLQTSE